MALETEPIELVESGKVTRGAVTTGVVMGPCVWATMHAGPIWCPGTATSQPQASCKEHSPSEPQCPCLKQWELSQRWDVSA